MHELLDCHVGITTRLNGHHSAFVPTRWSLRQIYISGSVFIAQEVRSTMAKVTQVAMEVCRSRDLASRFSNFGRDWTIGRDE